MFAPVLRRWGSPSCPCFVCWCFSLRWSGGRSWGRVVSFVPSRSALAALLRRWRRALWWSRRGFRRRSAGWLAEWFSLPRYGLRWLAGQRNITMRICAGAEIRVFRVVER